VSGGSGGELIGNAFGAGGRDLSVMIPTFNSAGYLGATLSSLHDQGIGQAQVEVVDDASRDDPEAVVARLGAGQVTFHRHERNIGMVANFNACIERAERPWVQILHGDDLVLPDGYAGFDHLLGQFPHCRAAFARVVTIDQLGRWQGTSAVLGEGFEGELGYSTLEWGLAPVQFAGVVFQRAAADEAGRFDPSLSHCADWDMWWRLARRFPVAYTNQCLAAYRVFEGNDSSALRRSAENLRQSLSQLNRIAAADDRHDRAVYWPLFQHSVHQARRFAGDRASLLAHLKLLASFPRVVPRSRAIARMSVAHAAERFDSSIGWRRRRDFRRLGHAEMTSSGE
jgi:glycosyltransferase involved in cell wall biosynthesis